MKELRTAWERGRSRQLLRVFISLALVTIITGTTGGCTNGVSRDLSNEWDYSCRKGFSDFRNNQFEHSLANYHHALDIADRFPADDPRMAYTLNDVARVCIAQGNYQTALDFYSRAVSLFEHLKSQADKDVLSGYCEALTGRAEAAQRTNENLADSYYQQAIEQATKSNIANQLRTATFAYAAFLRERGETDKAEMLSKSQEAKLATLEPPSSGDEPGHAGVAQLMSSGTDALMHHNTAIAELRFRQAFQKAQDLKDKIPAANCATRLGVIALSNSKNADAESWLRSAMQLYAMQVADIFTRREAVSAMTTVLTREGKFAEAKVYADQLLKDSARIKSKDGHEVREALNALTQLYATQNRWDLAIESGNTCYENARQYQPITNPESTLTMCTVGNAYFLGRRQAFRKWVDAYVEDAVKRPRAEMELPARLLDDYAEVCAKSDHGEEAVVFAAAAEKLLHHGGVTGKELQRSRALQKRTS